MATFKVEWQIQVTDINGDVAQVRVPVANADTKTLAAMFTDLGNFATLLEAVTNGKITRQGASVLFNEAQYLVGTAPPTDAEYSSVTDGARLQFADGAGERSSITIPAVIEAAFGANSNIVDSTQADVAALIAYWKGHAGSLSGANFNLYKGGVKVGRGTRRRRSALIP